MIPAPYVTKEKVLLMSQTDEVMYQNKTCIQAGYVPKSKVVWMSQAG